MNKQNCLYRKIFYKYLLIFYFSILPIVGFTATTEEYWEECEKCVKGQYSISGSIDMYIMDSDVKNFEIRSEEDYQNFLKIAYDRKYIKEPFVGVKEECSYRYDPEKYKSYCIKHGSLEHVKSYTYYKEAHEKQKKENLIFSLIGVGLLVFAIFFDK